MAAKNNPCAGLRGKAKDDPVLDLAVRVARLEERTNDLHDRLKDLKCAIRKLDTRLWGVLAGVILSVLLQIALHFA